MKQKVYRIFVEKKQEYNVEGQHLLKDFKINLDLSTLEYVRIINRYDISGINETELATSIKTIFSEETIDLVYKENFPVHENEYVFAVEYLPGQYDQRADSAVECLQLIFKKRPIVRSSKVLVLKGSLAPSDIQKIKHYYINPVDTREASLDKYDTLEEIFDTPSSVEIITGFIDFDENGIQELHKRLSLAMSLDDLRACHTYFKYSEKRNPTITEIKVLDTYWSDHCRHTTFLTEINHVDIESGNYTLPIASAFREYCQGREVVYGPNNRAITLMDIALMAMKELKHSGKLQNLDESDEINACSIKVPVEVDGVKEDWLVMFKNETHNHPTEIEPFGGAATCLGGAIRDPLSGRSYVYQAMRVTGSGDPRTALKDTLPGKLSQRKITTEAAHGYSSYGNQIGLSTGLVSELYHGGYVTKRMEIGAVIGAAPAANVIRLTPVAGDKVILLGGRTGRDGCGGATGSSKKHTEESIEICGAEVQKGNPPIERKLQRLFRNREVTTLIKRCNDFGAGGVSVAIGELADGLLIDLDNIPRKYEGLDGTELAISESQERMAVVVSPENVDTFISLAQKENVEATVVAEVTDDSRLIMKWKGNIIVNLSREFLNTNGAKTYTTVIVKSPKDLGELFEENSMALTLEDMWLDKISDLNVCSQKGLIERFDSTIGAGTVLMPLGGKYQLTPIEAMVCKLPVLEGNTDAASIMSYGFNPRISEISPFHGAVYAIVEAVSKVVAVGGDYHRVKLTLQEYFERLGSNPERWGKPFAALLGAYFAQKRLEIAAIGGKDSMSGSFNDLDVPPTLVAFAVDVIENCSHIVSSEFKSANSKVFLIETRIDDNYLPDFEDLKRNLSAVTKLIKCGRLKACSTVKSGGICEAITKMTLGNKIGFRFDNKAEPHNLFSLKYGSFILEVEKDFDEVTTLKGLNYDLLGYTVETESIQIGSTILALDHVLKKWMDPLDMIFPTTVEVKPVVYAERLFNTSKVKRCNFNIGGAKPKVFIPVFPGTNCEYDSARAFEKAGGKASIQVFRNLSSSDIYDSVRIIEQEIKNSNILMFPGGFSAGDEPDGSGKFIANVFRNPILKEAVMDFLQNRDGLILGICNGFQVLIKLGLLPYGEIREIDKDCPTLTYNTIGRHVSCMVNTKVVSNLSPWFSSVKVGDIHTVPVSHGEGRFVAQEPLIEKLFQNGQIATQYVDLQGNAVSTMPFNPNGSMYAVEGITSADGRILGKMAHSERIGKNLYKNIPGNKDQKIFESGIKYFK
ncbi:phosphoribosylformylglycinamidine synthase [Clostridium thermarum]|uniref:phosphoribosylformylglycinamidine synthase n=1 Tax=Clostridium thermarum TaxID=1716543 RepID=UPI0013D4F88D|nr:phosphoribosylformylglycinamidine synthase [Clostridium thermarum]